MAAVGSPVVAVAWLAGRATSKVPAGVADPSLTLLRTADGVLTVGRHVRQRRVQLRLALARCWGRRARSHCATRPARLSILVGNAPPATRRDWRPRFADAYRLELGAWVASIAGRHAHSVGYGRRRPGREPVADAVLTSMHSGGAWVEVDTMSLTGGAARGSRPLTRGRRRRCAGALVGTGVDRRPVRARRCSSTPVSGWSRSAPVRRTRLGRSPTGTAIAAAHGVVRRTWSADTDVDVVYVATPHNAHLPGARCCALERRQAHPGGEAARRSTAEEARQIADRGRGGAACSAWRRCGPPFLPKFDVIRQLPDSGRSATPPASWRTSVSGSPTGHRILQPELAGGPLLDLGTYLVAFALDVLGPVEATPGHRSADPQRRAGPGRCPPDPPRPASSRCCTPRC